MKVKEFEGVGSWELLFVTSCYPSRYQQESTTIELLLACLMVWATQVQEVTLSAERQPPLPWESQALPLVLIMYPR